MVRKRRKIVKLLVVFLIFIFAISLRLWNLDKMGRTWDEPVYIEHGYKILLLIKQREFNNPLLRHFDYTPLADYLYGFFGQYDIVGYNKVSGEPIYRYDWTSARMVSVVFSSLTAVLIAMMGWSYVNPFVGCIAGIVFSMFPFFLGLSQLATIESILIFFFTATIYSFLNFLKTKLTQKKYLILTGVSMGLAFETKYTNILLIPLVLWIYSIWYSYKNKKREKFFNPKIVYIFLIAVFVFFLLWPMPWLHAKEFLNSIYQFRFVDIKYSIPEVFFGRLMFVPIVYYVIYFLITTPLLLLILFLIGLKSISRKNWFLYSVIAWFVLPFIQSFYNFRQHGIRYIIEIYAPLALLIAVGFDFISSKFTKKIWLKTIFFAPILLYMFVILFRITPYYLDYFNEVVGGTKNVYEKKLFQIGWWGQGIREAANYLINNAPKNSRIGYAISPIGSLPPFTGFNANEYENGQQYDYVIVNYFHVLREGFDDSNIRLNYKEIYNAKADSAHLVTVYKRK